MRNGYQRLPPEALQLWFAVEDVPLSPAAKIVRDACMTAAAADTPRTSLNRALVRQKQRARPWLYARLSDWLNQSDVLQAARRHGAYWALKKWQAAAVAMRNGASPHAALGMHRPGRRAGHQVWIAATYSRSTDTGAINVKCVSPGGFSMYQDAAFIFEHHRRAGNSVKAAMDDTVAEFSAVHGGGMDERDVRRWRKDLKVAELAPDELDVQCASVRWKIINGFY